MKDLKKLVKHSIKMYGKTYKALEEYDKTGKLKWKDTEGIERYFNENNIQTS